VHNSFSISLVLATFFPSFLRFPQPWIQSHSLLLILLLISYEILDKQTNQEKLELLWSRTLQNQNSWKWGQLLMVSFGLDLEYQRKACFWIFQRKVSKILMNLFEPYSGGLSFHYYLELVENLSLDSMIHLWNLSCKLEQLFQMDPKSLISLVCLISQKDNAKGFIL